MRAAMTAGCLIGMTTLASLAASAFERVWKVKDTDGRPFEITLSSGGVAKATRGDGMTGTWKEEENAGVIRWTTGWTTKITKEGNQYKKTACRKGQAFRTLHLPIVRTQKGLGDRLNHRLAADPVAARPWQPNRNAHPGRPLASAAYRLVDRSRRPLPVRPGSPRGALAVGDCRQHIRCGDVDHRVVPVLLVSRQLCKLQRDL